MSEKDISGLIRASMRNVSKPFSQIGRNLGLGSGEIYRFIAEPHLLSRWYLEDIDQFIDFVVECDLLLTALPDILDYVASQAAAKLHPSP